MFKPHGMWRETGPWRSGPVRAAFACASDESTNPKGVCTSHAESLRLIQFEFDQLVAAACGAGQDGRVPSFTHPTLGESSPRIEDY
jgi:hypothetical protein